ncbi:metallophosphoesterase [Candidatus Sumerlaeota bacterium]|nr:metallophosphoesterase [Candidatus Sumerlaeota bacterium]
MSKTRYRIISGAILVSLIIFSFIFLFSSSSSSEGKPLFPGIDALHSREGNIIIISDTQRTGALEFWREKNFPKTRRLLQEIAERNPAFIAILGDLTTNGSSIRNWRFFEDAFKPVIENKIPCFPVLGNHDYWGSDKKALRNFTTRFPLMKDATWYSFTYKRIGFIMLNSNFDNLSDEEIQKQNKWFREQMDVFENSEEIDFTIACCHHSPYTNSRVISASEEVRNNFAAPFQKYKKAALFLTGHCHSYEKFLEGGKYFIVTGGGGGPRQKLEVDKKKRQFNDLFEGPEIRFFHFCEMETIEKKLILKVWKLNEDDTFSLADQIEINGVDPLEPGGSTP